MMKIPQVVSIVSVSREGVIYLSKELRKQLGVKGAQPLFLNINGETLLSANEPFDRKIPKIKGNRIRLPDDVLENIGVSEGSLVGFVQRSDGVAVKGFEVVEEEGEIAELYDLETPLRIIRMAKTNPLPEKILPKLKEQYKDIMLKHDVKQFLKGRLSFEAWKARKILGMANPSDEELRNHLVKERLDKQLGDGSWEEKTTVTARNLRELADLGLTKDEPEIKKGVEWLLARPQSTYNPGMFFAYDELVEEQRRIREKGAKQKHGTRERFNQRRAREVNLVQAGDSLIRWPCGPRITWTTALVLEALLKLGYEENERVQAALRTISTIRWCDNAQQYGTRKKEPCSMGEVEKKLEEGIQKYRRPYCGSKGIREVERGDMSHVPFHMKRTKHTRKDGIDEFILRLPEVGGGCPVHMTRALSHVTNERLRRLAEAQLWTLAGGQHSQDLHYSGKYTRKKYACPQAMFLQVFASYDHPVSELVITRMLPWIIENQNKDGSWGKGETTDTTTLAVVRALKYIGFV